MTLVDTNVVIDITSKPTEWLDWSLDSLTDARIRGEVFINDVVFAELAARYVDPDKLEKDLAQFQFAIRRIPLRALFNAGQAYARYRKAGGERQNVLSDFLIGGHAEHLGVPLLTRDPKMYRAYFPELELITP